MHGTSAITEMDSRIDGAGSSFWEPVWQVLVTLTPLEQALLASQPLRRLHFVAHNGSSALITGLTYSRLQHTLGVFALVTHFHPNDPLLRIAALLHDVGHFPFSHTLEGLPGVDHHAVTQTRLQGPEISPILEKYGVDIAQLTPLLEGSTPSLLRNQQGVLHLDHLDSWVRGAQARGQLRTPPRNILGRLREVDGYLDTDLGTAEALVELIVAEAHFHASAVNLGSTAVLKELVGTLLNEGELDISALGDMTDAQLTAQLFASSRTAAEARKLWFGPDRLQMTRIAGDKAVDGLLVRKDKLYLSRPNVDGKPVTTTKVRTLERQAASLLGAYRVFWQV